MLIAVRMRTIRMYMEQRVNKHIIKQINMYTRRR